MTHQTTPKNRTSLGEKLRWAMDKTWYIYQKFANKAKTGLIIALTAGTLTACSPDVDKLEEKIIDQTEQVENKIKALKELNAQYKTLKVIVSQKQTVAQAGTKMHNNIRNDQQELRKMEKKLREESKKIDTQLEEIKTLRVEFTNAGGDITTLGEYPNFDITIQGLENEFQSIKLP